MGDIMKIVVIDGQGGGIGKTLVERLRAELGSRAEIMALGTNSIATSQMLKAGADIGATGENAIVVNACKADVIVGGIGIVAADSMMGEMTPKMAKAVADSKAKKVLIPQNRCNIYVAGSSGHALPYYIDAAVQKIKEFVKGGN